MSRLHHSERLPVPRYEGVRKILAPPYRNLRAEEIESVFESVGIDAEDAEDFLGDVGRTLGRIGRQIAPAASAALPAVGTVVGTAVGGPVGGALGGALGSVAGQAIGAAAGPRRPAAPQTAGAPRPVPAAPRQEPVAPRQEPAAPRQEPAVAVDLPPVVPMAPPATAPSGAQVAAPAAAQLLQVMLRPEVLQALLAMSLGQVGRTTVSVGQAQVPLGAFTNLLGRLADQAAAEYNAVAGSTDESVPGYLEAVDEEEADMASPDARAVRLLSLFAEADQQRAARRARRMPPVDTFLETEYDEDDEFYDEDEELYDELELVELYANYEF